MRKIDIGILRAARIKFRFIGDYMFDGSSVGGENVVCCGSDFDGASVHESLNSPVKFAGFADYMLAHGISETVVKKIMWENAADFMKKYMK